MKPCDRYEELISRLVDGELNREEYDALIAHIGECSRCNALYAAFNAMSDLMREEPAPLPEGLHENIMAGVRRSAIEKKNRRMRVVWTRTALTAAACLALVLFASRGFAPDKKAESAALRSKEAAEEILPAAPMEEAALPDEVQEAAPAEPSATPLPEKTPAPTPVPVLEGNPAPLPSPSGSPVAAAGTQRPTVTESPRPTPGATAKPAASAAAVSTPTPVPASTVQPSPSVTPAPTAQASPEATATAAEPAEAPQSLAVSPAAEQSGQAPEAAVRSPTVSASAVTPSPEVQTKSGAVQADTAAAEPVPAAEESAAPSLRAAAPKPQESEPPVPAASESPAAETEEPEETPVSNRKGLRSLFRMPLLPLEPDPGQSAEEETAESAGPSPSEEPSPTPSPTPSAEASPAETSPVIIHLEIRADADYDELLELLDLEPAKLPEGKLSRIYRVLWTPEKEGTASEELEIYVIDDEVYCLRSIGDTSKTYRAGCGAAELKTLIKRLQAAASPEPEESVPPLPGVLKPKPVSEKSTETPAPSGTPESSPRVSEAPVAHTPAAENGK